MTTRTKTKATTKKKVALMVTTVHKGVFFGYGTPTSGSEIKLEEARMCIYWSGDVKGVIGLAATGPTKKCKISQAASSLILRDVTSVSEVSAEAVKAWESAPWS